jgi:hypothetical protein
MRIWNKKSKRLKMLPKSHLSMALLAAILLVSCRTTKESTQSSDISEYSYVKETVVPVAVPADSLTLQALFECDSLNNVLMRSLNEKKSSNISSLLSFADGVLSYSAVSKPDSIKTVNVEKGTKYQKTVTINTKTIETKYLRGFLWWSGVLFWIVLLTRLIIKSYLKITSNKYQTWQKKEY